VKTIKTVSAVASGNKYFSRKTGTEVWYQVLPAEDCVALALSYA
jgi:hypothetical protein